jgi:acetyl/propionyl-CoA carboxylase alpha subunit
VKELRVTHNGKPFKVRSLKVGSNLWLHVNGETYVIDQSPKRAKSSSDSAARESSGQILSPMPGKILKVRVAVGDAVDIGQILVVMEAMKMEYSLIATVKGRVKTLSAKENEQVELNQLLVELEETPK